MLDFEKDFSTKLDTFNKDNFENIDGLKSFVDDLKRFKETIRMSLTEGKEVNDSVIQNIIMNFAYSLETLKISSDGPRDKMKAEIKHHCDKEKGKQDELKKISSNLLSVINVVHEKIESFLESDGDTQI